MPKIIGLDVNIFFSVIGAIMLGLLSLVFYLVKLKITEIDKKRDKETCDRIHQPIDKAISGIADWDKKLDRKRNKETCDKIRVPIDKTLVEVREFMLSRRSSPRDFSEHAKAIFVQSRLQKFIDERIDELFGRIDEMKPENVYDAEVMAEKVMRQFNDEEVMKTGAERADVSVETVLFVSAIYLGKKYIEKHPELPEELNKAKI